MNYLLAKLLQPSTQAGLAAALQAAAFFFPQYSAIFAGLTLVFGGAAATMPHPEMQK